jgi:hypothetical protein
MRLYLILSPNLRTSSMKVSRLLKEIGGGYQTLLLNLPWEMDEIVTELASEHLSYDELVHEALRCRLIPEPVGSWEYAFKPILDALRPLTRMYPDLRTCCYGRSENEFALMNAAVRMTSLTLRTMVKGEVELDEWRDVLVRSLDVDREVREAEIRAIDESMEDSSICLSDLGGRGFKRRLKSAELRVMIHYVEKPFHFTPLMILKRKMARGSVRDEDVEALIRRHVEYVRSYIYRFDNRDRAYYEWAYDKVPWLRRRISKEEVEIINRIIIDS